MVKPRLYSDSDDTKAAALWTLKNVLITGLKLLHPYMPFITEEIYTTLREDEPNSLVKNSMEESIMISSWPVYSEDMHFDKEEREIGMIKDAVKAIRNVRTAMNVPLSRKAKVFVVSGDDTVRASFTEGTVFFASLAHASEVAVQSDKCGIEDNAVSAVIPQATIYMPFSDLVDTDKEIERLTKEKKRLEGELKRSHSMLANEKFLSKAPAAKVEEEKEKLAKYEDMMKKVDEELANLK